MNAFTKTLQMLLLLQENRSNEGEPVILRRLHFRLQPSEACRGIVGFSSRRFVASS